MRLGVLLGSKPAFFDRNPSSELIAFTLNGEEPHIHTERDTYTVPSGKKAYVEVIQLDIVRITAATTPERAYCGLDVVPSGSASLLVNLALLFDIHNAVGDDAHIFLAPNMVLAEGDEIILVTRDQSSGGTIAYNGSVKLTEFDA